jgi:hypothetical protein
MVRVNADVVDGAAQPRVDGGADRIGQLPVDANTQESAALPAEAVADDKPQSLILLAIKFASTKSRIEHIDGGPPQVPAVEERSVEGRFEAKRSPSRAALPIFSLTVNAEPKS